jgi:hypothetical protein
MDGIRFEELVKYPETLEGVNEITDPVIRAAALERIVRRYAASSKPPQDAKWFPDVSEIAQGLEQGAARARVFAYTARVLLKANDTKNASRILAEAVNDALTVKEHRSKTNLLRGIAEMMAKAGLTDLLTETFKSLKKEQPESRVWFCIGAAQGAIERGQQRSNPDWSDIY